MATEAEAFNEWTQYPPYKEIVPPVQNAQQTFSTLGKTMTGTNYTPGGSASPTDLASQYHPEMASAFGAVLRNISRMSYNDRVKKGDKTMMQGLGVNPSEVSGKTFANIMDSVESGAGGDISKEYAATMDTWKFSQQEIGQRLQDIQKNQNDVVDRIQNAQSNGLDIPYTAEELQAVGISPGPLGLPMRTDRNMNPTAMTTDVAASCGLVYGTDYIQGDKFPGDSNLYTAKLIGDPIAITIKAIDQGGFTTQSGKNRWSYTQNILGANNKEWQNLTYDQKVNVVKQMYQHEGGNGVAIGQAPANQGTGYQGTHLTNQERQKVIAMGIDPNDKQAAYEAIYGVSGYTPSEVRVLRQAGIDPHDQKAADDYLSGPDKGITPADKTQMKQDAAVAQNVKNFVREGWSQENIKAFIENSLGMDADTWLDQYDNGSLRKLIDSAKLDETGAGKAGDSAGGFFKTLGSWFS